MNGEESNDIINDTNDIIVIKDLKEIKYRKLTSTFIEEYLNNKIISKYQFCKQQKISINTLNKYLRELKFF